MAKKGQLFKTHSPEFKISVIMDMQNNHLGIRETGRKYHVDHSVVVSAKGFVKIIRSCKK